MKLSKFNIMESMGENTIIYNSLTSGVLFLNKDYSLSLKELIETGHCEREDLINELTKGSMLIEDDMNEVDALKTSHLRSRFSESGLGLTIAPTLNCNFNCPYCYEDGYRRNSMNHEVKERVIEFIDNYSENISFLSIAWYGGEPLLGLNTIEYLTNKIKEKLNDNIKYEANIVTNGYNLTEKVALKLRELNISRAQVTIDGPPDIHDKRRGLLNGAGSFHKIIENISKVHSIIPIVIRINVDKTNMDRAEELLDYFEEYNIKNKVPFYLANVDDTATTYNPTCFETQEFSIEEINFYEKALNRGFNAISIPSANLGVCGAISTNGFVIDPKGDLYKCWNEIGRVEERIGDIFNGVSYSEKHTKWMVYDPLKSDKCTDCSVLPVCFGGCPYIAMTKKENECDSIRYNASKTVKLFSTIKKANLLQEK